ncbi:hypothetical protein ACOMHN_011362 [Nucella lapillus]
MSKKRKTSNVKFYAVTKGRKTGIFTTWNEASDSVTGFHGAAHKSYGSLYKAKEAIKISGHSDPVVYGDEYKEETVSEVSDMSDEEHEHKSAQETEKEQTESVSKPTDACPCGRQIEGRTLKCYSSGTMTKNNDSLEEGGLI